MEGSAESTLDESEFTSLSVDIAHSTNVSRENFLQQRSENLYQALKLSKNSHKRKCIAVSLNDLITLKQFTLAFVFTD